MLPRHDDTNPNRKVAMNRRDFFKKTAAVLGTLFLLPGRNRQAAAAPRTIPLTTCYIAGFQFHDGPAIIDRLRPGLRLDLRREPDNPYDRRAIAVYAGSRHIGYIPRAINTIPADQMDQGQRLTAAIRAVNREAPPWFMVEIELGMEV